MTEPVDAALLAALEAQARDLGAALHRLEAAQRDLVPPPANFWRGSARHAYDAAIEAIATTVEAGIGALRSARNRSAAAAAGMADRG